MTGLHLAVAFDGVGWHPAAWREDPADARRLQDPRYWVALAQQAEHAALDFMTIDDTFAIQSETYGTAEPRTDRVRGRLDSVLVASRIAPLTRRLGIVPTVVVTHTEPFHIAKAIATLDHVSTGRAGVRLKVGITRTEARLLGRRDVPAFTLQDRGDPTIAATISDAFDEAADYGEVLRRLWDSWEDDAEIRDVATGRFIDRDKLHYVDFAGRWFSIKGPLTVPRPPQGQPIVSVLGHGTEPYWLGVRTSDIVYVTPRDPDDVRTIIAEIRDLEAGAPRTPPPTSIFGDVAIALDTPAASGAARLHRLDELAGGPWTSDALVFAGSVTELADLTEAWTAWGLDGIRLRPATNRADLPTITQGLVPELRRRGLRPGAYRATTLRGHLGLARPVSRYAREEAS